MSRVLFLHILHSHKYTFSTTASHGSQLIIMAFRPCSECLSHSHACPPNKMGWVTVAEGNDIERSVGFFSFFFFYFLIYRKKLPCKSTLNCKAFLLLYTSWLSPDTSAYSAEAKARTNAGPKEKYQERNTTEDSWGKHLL